jgi:hypothetical protein
LNTEIVGVMPKARMSSFFPRTYVLAESAVLVVVTLS